MRGRHHRPWAQEEQVLPRSRAVGRQVHQAGASSSDTGQLVELCNVDEWL